MARVLITGCNQKIGAGPVIVANGTVHDPIGKARHGQNGTTALTRDIPETIAGRLADIRSVDLLIKLVDLDWIWAKQKPVTPQERSRLASLPSLTV